jgi:PTS system nitrogen regulatory IIA component
MQISDFLSQANVLPNVRAADKDRLLLDLSKRAASACQLNPVLVIDEITKRERLGSTGMGDGIAIPHARIEGLSKPFGVFARLTRSIDFAAIDGEPVDIVFFLLLPTKAQGEQLTALASVARKLRDSEVISSLRGAADGSEIYRVVTS